MEPLVALLSPPEEEFQRLALAQLFASYQGDVVLLATPAAELSNPVRAQWMIDGWPDDLSALSRKGVSKSRFVSRVVLSITIERDTSGVDEAA